MSTRIEGWDNSDILDLSLPEIARTSSGVMPNLTRLTCHSVRTPFEWPDSHHEKIAAKVINTKIARSENRRGINRHQVKVVDGFDIASRQSV